MKTKEKILDELKSIFSFRTKVDLVLIPHDYRKGFVSICDIPVDYRLWKGSHSVVTPYGEIGLAIYSMLVSKIEVFHLERKHEV